MQKKQQKEQKKPKHKKVAKHVEMFHGIKGGKLTIAVSTPISAFSN